jgi:hypothetical protein
MSDFSERPLIRRLRKTVREENGSIAGLELAAKTLAGQPAEVAALLTWCTSSSARWHHIAQRAYCHPNGFTKFVLYDASGSLFRLRLHVWTGEHGQRAIQDEQNIHGHRWDFASAVIAGPGLDIAEYVRCETGGTPYRSYEYRPCRGNEVTGAEFAAEGTDLVPAGEVLLEHAVRFLPQAGESYSCSTDKLHTVRSISDDLTATLIVQGPSVMAHAPVFRRADQPVQGPPRPVTEAEARQVMDAVITGVRQLAGE